ncbi:MAG: phosphoribosylanthranilate isomerase [bacterium]|nr:phosphoribosylanthranilate isomerase [bacterium]
MNNFITRVKVCCISSIDEANLAIKYGASALGLVSKMPSGPGVISDELITEIIKIIPPGVASFLLTSEVTSAPVIVQQKKFGVNTIQLVDELNIQEYAKMKDAMPGVSLVQVVHVINEASVDYAVRVSDYADALLLDSGNPGLKLKELGGTGRVHDWKLSKAIRESISIPVYLAGGLNAENVAEAIDTVEPFAVDLCSGVRSNGELDEAKLISFFDKVRSR